MLRSNTPADPFFSGERGTFHEKFCSVAHFNVFIIHSDAEANADGTAEPEAARSVDSTEPAEYDPDLVRSLLLGIRQTGPGSVGTASRGA